MMAPGSLTLNVQPKPLLVQQRPKQGSDDSSVIQQRIAHCLTQAKDAAAQGDVAASARLILAALDGERRLASRGPQVLQLIKPRG